ncbi:hypothetical protein [Kineococcus esterisolvens]|uniref:hypothetical protein n=1 Tax=unclassified Kineococcus TaxID=2621656 RepID=UPI003D7D19D1
MLRNCEHAVTVFTPQTPARQIEHALNRVADAQAGNEMGRERYAFLFQPGTYGSAEDPLQLRVGYYTEIAGLGESPSDVTLHGKAEVFDRCFGPSADTSRNALTNFWRTVSDLRIGVDSAAQEGCRAGTNFWAVSQALSMCRVEFTWAAVPDRPLLHGPVPGQRRLHRRLEAAERGGRLPAAVAHA